MLCYDFICTYKLMDTEEDENLLYQYQLLQAFNLETFDGEKITLEQSLLYDQIKESSNIQEIIELLKIKYPTLQSDNSEIFKYLFSFDYFDIFHKYLREKTNNNNNNEIYANLIKMLKS